MSKDFSRGVTYFVKGIAHVAVSFPEGVIKCHYCPYCRPEKDLERFWCRLTNTMLYNPFVEGLPEGCPIEITGEVIGTPPKERREN